MNIRKTLLMRALFVSVVAVATPLIVSSGNARALDLPVPVPPTTRVTMSITNESRYSAWVDISSSRAGIAEWTIRRALCIEAGKSSTESDVPIVEEGQGDAELRVRAELKQGNCRSGNVKTVQSKISFGNGGMHNAYAKITNETVILSHKPM